MARTGGVGFMFCIGSNFGVKTLVLGAALLAYPSVVLAQHGGGRVGGGLAGGGGLSGNNHATGIETKDDLSTFHEIMAVQASSEQKLAYAEMLKRTAVAGVQLKAFTDQIGKGNN